ncbi:MAG: methyltransferase [Candidatus Methylomirabilales bacterium]
MARPWTPDAVMDLLRGFHAACVIAAAAELDVFTRLHAAPAGAAELARGLACDVRATTILLDALAALQLLDKRDGVYAVPADVAAVLAEGGSQCLLGMARHLGNCLRRWARLGEVVQTGAPVLDEVSVRGKQEDLASFIRAMHEVSAPLAPRLIESLGPPAFRHVLDLGGASGTWTIPFLRARPDARATIFDLPEVIPMAKRAMQAAGMAHRVRLVAGNYETDELPSGCDLAWVSAIVHQNSRAQNRAMFARACRALEPGGRILIRDILVDGSRTAPVMGALFAVNMLVGTPGGGTYTFDELREDLEAAGFTDARLVRRGEAMDSVIAATKPGDPGVAGQ